MSTRPAPGGDLHPAGSAGSELAVLLSAFEHAPVGLAVADVDGRFQRINARFAEMLGYDPDELVGLTFREITHPDDVARTANHVVAMREGRTRDVRLEKRYLRRDGSEIWCRTSIVRLDTTGEVVRFVGVIEDITEQRADEQARRATMERLELALTAGQLGDWSWRAADDAVELSPQAAALFGLPYGEPVTWAGLRARLHPEDAERARVAVEVALAERARYAIEYRVRTGERAFRWIAATGRGIYDDDGRVLGMSGVVQDVSERLRNEAALREESRVLELLNQTAADIASTLHLSELLQRITDAATRLSGAQFGAFFYNAVDANGESLQLYTLSGAPREAFAGFGHPRATALFGVTFRAEGIVRVDDIHLDPRYGRMAPHHGMPPGHLPVRSYLAVPVVARDGEAIGGLFFGHEEVGVFTERAERLVAGVAAQAAVAIDNARLYERVTRAAGERERLLEAERAAREHSERVGRLKDEFLATLSHELRTPLNAILGWSQILLGGKARAEDQQRGVEAIARNARAQTQLVDDLLDMNRIVSGKLRLTMEPLALADVVDAALDGARPAALARRITLDRRVDPEATIVLGDPQRLQQVVWNLLSNAIKFTPAGRRVEIRVEARADQACIVVSDEGQGIEPAFLPYVFDRFRQQDASTTREHGGLGLGLSIVRSLVELHGGRVEAASDGPGLGARFTVCLPRVQADAPAISTDAGQATSTPLRAIDVLVVDDAADARELLRRILSDEGAKVRTVESASAALAAIAAARPQVIVSDIGMPGMDGYAFIESLRRLPPREGGTVPAIALTAFARPEDRAQALRAGFQRHLTKPVEPPELIAAIAALAQAPSLAVPD